MRIVEGPVGPVIRTDQGGGVKLNFCSNDYLGLAGDPRIAQAMIRAVKDWGAGTGSSRLVSGNTRAHHQLEQTLAAYMGTDAAVVFPSGYQANVGALFALTQAGDAIFSDALVHASVVDGARLSKADVHVYRHSDVDHLNDLLKANKTEGLKLVVTDAVFSMDGDKAPLKGIAKTAAAHGALLYVDEAHALGILGPEGRGLAANAGVSDQVAVLVGTFGKAIGTAGAFVATSQAAAGLIRSQARSLLYTTAMPAALVTASAAGLDIARRADDRRQALGRNIRTFRDIAEKNNLPVLASQTPIQPVMVGDAKAVIRASEALWQRGVFVQGMRPPTVPEHTSRLRVSITAAHTQPHIDQLVNALTEVL